MTQRILSITLMLLTVCGLISRGTSSPKHEPQVVDGKVVLSADSLKNDDKMIELFGDWKYQPGDDPAWADSDSDDSSWEGADTFLERNKLPKVGWKGIGWFRLHLDVDPTLWNKPLALEMHQAGASEIYLDGVLYQFPI